MVRHTVPQLPIGQNHTLVRRQGEGIVALQVRALANGTDRTPALSARPLFPFRQQDGKIGEIIIENETGRQSVALAKRMAQAAIGPLEAVRLLLGQLLQCRKSEL